MAKCVMPHNPLILLLVTLFSVALEAQTPSTVDRDFVSGGDIKMQLCAGEYKITPSHDGKIHISWTARTDSYLRRSKITADVKGSSATIHTDAPDNAQLKVKIQIPAQSNLVVRFTAGDFNIDGIEGSKDVAGYAGDLSIDVGDPSQYKEVHASVTTGDLNADAFHVAKDGLWRSFDRSGSGPYILRVKLMTGSMRLYSHPKAGA